HQFQNFGPEIIWAFGPAQAAARHFRPTQMHSLHKPVVNVNLGKWPGVWHVDHAKAADFQRDALRRAFPRQKEVAPPRRVDEVEDIPQDPILGKVVDSLQRVDELLTDCRKGFDLSFGWLAERGVRLEPSLEVAVQKSGGLEIRRQCAVDTPLI